MDVALLAAWFERTKRELPWRGSPSPYQVWISEVMLQQTRAAVVVEYYHRWMERFPSVEKLAEASLEEVTKAWEGLGYYARARRLHLAARYFVEHHGGKIPEKREELERVAGLGPYTVGAILSFAFHKRAAAVDGNVVRVLTRFLGLEEDVSKPSVKKRLWAYAEEVLPEEKPWVVVEALIELGSTLCSRNVQCGICPLQSGCRGFASGRAEELPVKRKKVPMTVLEREVAVVLAEGAVLVKKVEEGNVMAGLYEFPYWDRGMGEAWDLGAEREKILPVVCHTFTRFRVVLYPSVWKILGKKEVSGYEWVEIDLARRLPFSSGHRRVLAFL